MQDQPSLVDTEAALRESLSRLDTTTNEFMAAQTVVDELRGENNKGVCPAVYWSWYAKYWL